jgi:hypothetical protein
MLFHNATLSANIFHALFFFLQAQIDHFAHKFEIPLNFLVQNTTQLLLGFRAKRRWFIGFAAMGFFVSFSRKFSIPAHGPIQCLHILLFMSGANAEDFLVGIGNQCPIAIIGLVVSHMRRRQYFVGSLNKLSSQPTTFLLLCPTQSCVGKVGCIGPRTHDTLCHIFHSRRRKTVLEEPHIGRQGILQMLQCFAPPRSNGTPPQSALRYIAIDWMAVAAIIGHHSIHWIAQHDQKRSGLRQFVLIERVHMKVILDRSGQYIVGWKRTINAGVDLVRSVVFFETQATYQTGCTRVVISPAFCPHEPE